MLRLREGLMLLMFCSLSNGSAAPLGELSEARRWVAAKFEGVQEEAPWQPGLIVVANHDPVQKNARGGRPMKIVDAEYTRGLYCHAHSHVIVRLPSPADTLNAIVGVDTNEQTEGGRGSVVFVVRAGAEEHFRSQVMREGMAGLPVEVELSGGRELELLVEDAGDGISCDQSDWAEARVALENGQTLWLADLPFAEWQPAPYDTTPPFSFTYAGKPSADLLPEWKLTRAREDLDANRTQHTLTWTDLDTGLEVRCVAVEYHDFPTVEWTLYLRNGGAEDTPILEDIQALDTRFERALQGEFVLHHHVGSICAQNDFQPLETPLTPNLEFRLAPPAGRPSDGTWPYFNIAGPQGGTIVAIGWPGQWVAHLDRDTGTALRVRAGQDLTHFRLHPGEEVRTPLIVLQFWQDDRLRSQNTWRRWMIEHNLPRPGGKLPEPHFAAASSHQFGEMVHANEANQKLFIDRYLEKGLNLDYWWMDAGWYPNQTGWPNTGTWEVDTGRFPSGLRAITDHAHGKGLKIIVWFEPERVTPGTWLYENHPEWLLGEDGGQKLLDLGNPEAREWLAEHVDRLLDEQGIDLYRQDFNMDPLAYWRANDADDRQGITEIRHVEGYLAYWDELRRRHPDMLIDTCASGGRRDDLETLRRAVPLHRSDYILESVGQQCHTYGLAFWVPYFGAGFNVTEAYGFRSTLCPHITACYDVRRDDIDYAAAQRLVEQWRTVAPHILLGDYYPLTPYTVATDRWIGWQFHRPETGEGVVQAFRRPDSIYESARLRLHGLDAEGKYEVCDLDGVGTLTLSGRELAEEGLLVTIGKQPGAALITYRHAEG
jgi:alpha-galactosidase